MKRAASAFIVLVVLTVPALAEKHYVWTNSPSPAAPYTNWLTAAHDIQSAIDASSSNDTVLVTNGVYDTGGVDSSVGFAVPGATTNRVVITNAITVRSVNGANATVIVGAKGSGPWYMAGTVRCAYVGANAVLDGFTLTNGYVLGSGGGVWCGISGVVSNCIIMGNSASMEGGGAFYGTLNNCMLSGNSAAYAGGACNSTLNDCTLSGNSAGSYGGGAYGGTLDGCVVSSNSATYGGGVWCEISGVVSNCIIMDNSASEDGGGAFQGTLHNCTLSGNSTTNDGGGAYNSTLNNCALSGNSAGSYGGGAYGGTLDGCVVSSNSAKYGGGTYESTLTNCTLSSNSASWRGGGSCYGTLRNCVLLGNSAVFSGGGAFQSTLNDCALSHNSADRGGGGTSYGMLNNCVLSSNSAISGAGSYYDTLNNCVLSDNSANADGGGAYGGTLNNCTLSGNSSAFSGGGAISSTLNNCIIWHNSALSGQNYSGGTLNYCCATPIADGTGNISEDPLLVSDSHLSAMSPCIGKGNSSYATGTDIDGEAWTDPPSIGCDEYRVGAVTGDLNVAIEATYTQCVVGFDLDFTAVIEGRTSASRWDLGDGGTASNTPYVSHQWSTTGSYPVALTAFNETYPAGISSTVTVEIVEQPVHYVALSNPAPVAPYALWDTAATNIQDAIDAANVAGALVLVKNGVYDNGGVAIHGTMTNRVAINKAITVRSVNGPANTMIVGRGPCGDGAVRCAYVGTKAVLDGFTLTNGYTRTSGGELTQRSGGGVWCENSAIVSNCILLGNSAVLYGGGAHWGAFHNCSLSGNSTAWCGGGASFSILHNCVLSANSTVRYGGGAFACVLTDCIIYYNSPNNCYQGTLDYCCTTPLAGGPGNITNDPAFVDYANGDYHLAASSMCINAGNNAYVTSTTDLDGNSRIQASVVDIGAYESPYAPIDAFVTGRGSIDPAGRIGVLVSSNQSFTMTVTPGYPPIRDVKIDGVSVGATNSYTFVNLTSNHTIEAIFWPYPDTNGYAIAGLNGSVSDGLVLTWTGTNGWKYTVQQSPSLMPPAWSNVSSYTNISGIGSIAITNDIGTATQMYYRLQAVESN